MGDRLPLILDSGDTGAALGSTIVELRDDTWRVIREGLLAEAEIRDVLGG
jgi:tRNA A37 threonylcarbamoyladenosine synthetase subunit TsaC/SUA5/YrdC